MDNLRFSALATERDLRLAIIEAGHLCYERGLITSNNGNISTRLGDDRLLITPAGYNVGRLDVDDLIVLDLAGNLLKKHVRRKLGIPPEAALHLEVYRLRPDVRAVIRAHPTFATALTIADLPLPVDVVPEVAAHLGAVPTSRFALPGSADMVLAVREHIENHNAILLRQQGSLTFGENLDEALNHLERVEAVAQTVYLAQALGTVNKFPAELLSKIDKPGASTKEA